ncbi:hypothetical protein HPG69_006049 [Diceros bicornis minor]|uniref:Uncharacterized protein n=1 Tax=Diceros bicornis minor TaxID=77932 RepID=A0A7J7EUK1_DICBM|nr:hypothetical protein HPG69_006049 [Diceros bicornis minor]
MEDLGSNGADAYWCGIERTGTDLGVRVQVMVDAAAYSTMPPMLLTTDRTEPVTTDTIEPVTTDTPASLASSSPTTQSVNSSQPLALTSPLSR